MQKDKILHINVFDGDDGIKYIRYNDMEKMLKRIKEVHDKIEDDLKAEIKRLKEELKYTVPVVEHNKTITKHIKEKEQLHSIIKEVRETIEKESFTYEHITGDYRAIESDLILEIIDKVEGKNEI